MPILNKNATTIKAETTATRASVHPASAFRVCDDCPGDGYCESCHQAGWTPAAIRADTARRKAAHDRYIEEVDRNLAEIRASITGHAEDFWGLAAVSLDDRLWAAANLNGEGEWHDLDEISPETDGVPADYIRFSEYYMDRETTERIEDAEYEARIMFGYRA